MVIVLQAGFFSLLPLKWVIFFHWDLKMWKRPKSFFLRFFYCCNGCWFLTAWKWRERGHGIAAGSAGGSFGLPTASQGCGRCHQTPPAAGLGVLTQGKNCTGSLGPTCAAVFTSSLADRNRYQLRVCLCCQVSAQSSAPEPFCLNCDSDSEHWIKEFYSMQLLSQGKKRLCALGLSYKLSITISRSIESCFQTSL